MKKILIVATIVIFGLTTISSCTKNSTSTPSNGMRATVNGAAFNSASATAIAATTSYPTYINISSDTLSFPQISLAINSWNGGTGTFPFDSLGVNVGIADYFADNHSYVQGIHGSLVITSVSKTSISGTFSFSGYNIVVTTGSFTAQRQ